MAAYYGGCEGRGEPDATFCICACHVDRDFACDDMHCSPVVAKATDNVRVKHINRDADAGKKATKRGARSLRKG